MMGKVKVNLDTCSMWMSRNDYYNTEDMRIKFKKLREFKDKVVKSVKK